MRSPSKLRPGPPALKPAVTERARPKRAVVVAGLVCLALLGATQLAGAQGTPTPVFTEVPGSPFDTVAPGGVLSQPHDVTFSPDGRFLVSANYNTSDLTVFSVGPNGTMTEIPGSPFPAGGENPNWLGFTPSGNFLAVVNIVSNDVVMFHVAADGTLTEAGATPASPGAHAYWGAFSPSGDLLAVANANFTPAGAPGTVSMFHVAPDGTLTPVTGSPFDTGATQTQSVAFARGGTLLGAANRGDGTVTMFDVAPNGQLSRIGSPHSVGAGNGAAWAMAISPDGSLVVTANQYSSISVLHLDLATGTLGPPNVIDLGATSGPRGVEFSPGGTLLATANFGNPFGPDQPLPANSASVFSVAPDGTLTEVAGSPYRAGPGNKHSVFSPNGSLFATANYLDNTVSVFQSAPLSIRKTSEGTVKPGGRVTYTITVHNARPVPVTGPLVVDDLTGVLDKAKLDGPPTATTGEVALDHNKKTLTWSGTLAPDETVTIHYALTVNEDARGVLHDNLIGVPDSTCTSNAGGTLGPECTVENEIVPPPTPPTPATADLAVSKTASVQAAHPGGQVQYALTVHNHGPNDATGVTLEDPYLAGLIVHLAQPSQGTCTVTPREAVRCRLGDLPAGGEALVLVTATVPLDATRAVVNRVSVFGHQDDPNPGNNNDAARVSIDPLPPPPTPDPGPQPVSALAIAKHVSHARALVGQVLTYTVTVVNRSPGEAAADVHVIDTSRLPLAVRSITASQGSCGHGPPFRCALGTVRPGGRVTITITAVARRPGLQINAAAVTTSSWQAEAGVARAVTSVRKPPPPPRQPPPPRRPPPRPPRHPKVTG